MGENEYRIGIIGLGFVGLPLAKKLVDKQYIVEGIDVDRGKISSLHQGKSYISDMTDEQIEQLMQSGKFKAVSEYCGISSLHVLIICVPTPLNNWGQPDLSYIQYAGSEIAHHGLNGQLVILESSTYPGTTEEVLLPILEGGIRKVGRDFNLAYSPERINPGDQSPGREKMPKIVSGATERCLKKVCAFYLDVFESVVPVSSTRAAEMVKVMENSQRFVNLSFVNEMTKFCELMQIDIWEVIHAINTKPYGNLYFYPGPGVGGHCIPVDPIYLEWKSLQLGLPLPFLRHAKSVNDKTPDYIVQRIGKMLPDRNDRNGITILLLGLTYKKDVKDLRESRSVEIMGLLIRQGFSVLYYDPLISEITIGRNTYRSTDLTEQLLRTVECTVILTDHSSLPMEFIVSSSRRIFDTRNATRSFGPQPHIVRL